MPRPAHTAPNKPMTSAKVLPPSGLEIDVAMLSPTIGNWANAELAMSLRRLSLFSSTKPSTVTKASSAGNSEKKP